jgi:hypothetical protein
MVLGFLDRSASDDIAIQIEGDRPAAALYAGDAVKATIRIEASKDVPVREVRAGLVRWERYQVIERKRRPKGGSTSRKEWRTDEEWVERETLVPEGTVESGFSRGFRVEYRIPAKPAPPGAATLTQLRWLLKVTADCPMARDANAEHELKLVVPIPQELSVEGAFGQPSDPQSAYMQFRLPGIGATCGDAVRGQLVVAPVKDLSGRRMRVELVREEVVTAGDRQHDLKATAATIAIADGVNLLAGHQATYDFAIDVPAESCPSRQTAYSQVRWKLKGVLDRALRSDYRVEQELLIANGPPRAAATLDS